MSERVMYMPTLPSTFNSLVGKTVKIETEEPQDLIELLGDLLGVTDYKTNKAAFWFLDTIALQLLHYKNSLDDQHRSVLISWLAGEMKLIRGSVTNKSSNEKLVSEYSTAQKITRSLIMEKSRDSENRNLQWKSSKQLQTSLSIENSQIDTFIDANVAVESSNLTHLNIALDTIIEATYNMYANELRYALIHAVFVTPIQLQIYHMPHTLRIPRQIKIADPKEWFDIQLRKRLEKAAYELTIPGKRTTTNVKREREVTEDLNIEVPPTPPHSLIDEEILANNRRFILPLIEAKEATQIYEMHAKNMI